MVKVVYLDVDEEITSVIDKIKKIKSQEIALYFPKRAVLIQSIVNLKMLKKQVDLFGKNAVIVTSDETGLNLAKKSGFKATKTLEKKEQVEKIVFDEEKPKIDIKKFLNDEDQEKSEQDNPFLTNKEKEDDNKKEKEIAYEPEKKDGIDKNDLAYSLMSSVKGSSESQQEDSENNKDKKNIFTQFLKKPKNGLRKKRASKKQKKDKIVLLPSFGVKTFLIFCLVSFIVVGIIFFVVLPKATISVVPKTEPFSRDFEVTVDGGSEGINYENLIIPGEPNVMEIKSRKENFESTGEKSVGSKSRGEIVLYNKFSSDPQILVASTRFENSGKIYYSLSEVTIPGATIEGGDAIPGEAKVTVEAEAAGEEYNMGPARFNIPGLPSIKQSDIFGQSVQGFYGGTSETKKIVSEEDLEKAKETLMADVFEQGLKALNDKVSERDMFVENAIKDEIVEIKSSSNPGDEVDNFNMEVKANIWTMFFAKDDLKDLLFANLHKDIPQEKFFINEDVEGGLRFEALNTDSDNNILVLKTYVSKSVAWKLDEKTIRGMLKGKTSDEVRKYLLENASVGEVNVMFWPFWVKRVPQIEKKIKFVLDTSKITDKILE